MTMTFPIHHNPDCGQSRNTLAMIEAVGYAPQIVDYRTAGWTLALMAVTRKPPTILPPDLIEGIARSLEGLLTNDRIIAHAT